VSSWKCVAKTLAKAASKGEERLPRRTVCREEERLFQLCAVATLLARGYRLCGRRGAGRGRRA
jgi:hypothetical protein